MGRGRDCKTSRQGAKDAKSAKKSWKFPSPEHSSLARLAGSFLHYPLTADLHPDFIADLRHVRTQSEI